MTRGVGRLIVLCGLPGSGKTTVARALEGRRGPIRLCSDEWMTALGIDLYDEAGRARVEALQRKHLSRLLTAGCEVIYESGGWSRAERDALRDRAREAGASVELRFLDVGTDALWQRLDARNHRLPGATALVRRDDLLRWSDSFEAPTLDELAQYDPPPANDFVPADFVAPRRLDASDMVLVPLGPEHNNRDHAAWMSSIDHIRATPGFPSEGEWPSTMSLEDNLVDLVRHALDFEARSGFTFTVLDPADDDVIGCVYIYPARDGDHDARVTAWVRASHAHLDTTLHTALIEWLAHAWPWTRTLDPRTAHSGRP